jgi:hypothetical protein
MIKKSVFRFIFYSGILFLFSCSKTEFVSNRQFIDLSGTWQFALDSGGIGIQDKWFENQLNETVKLPGTLDENEKGIINTNRDETMRLSRERTYEGMAWYQKKVVVEKQWEGKEIFLTLERTKPSKVWVDNQFAGESSTILTPQKFNLTQFLTPGEHTITILVNNGENSVPNGIKGSHAWTEHTQTNWNGIIGEIQLEAIAKNYIQSARVKPDIENKQANVTLKIINSGNEKIKAKIKLNANAWNTEINHNAPAKTYKITLTPGENLVELVYPIGNKMQLWSEFSPALYKLNANLNTTEGNDNLQVDFGMRKFSVDGTQFQINGLTTFLRGEHNACVFPMTGYPPMKTEEWQKIFRIAKTYGINHYRFHSWTPPMAAFAAADIEGIYMQPELPYWGRLLEDDPSGLNEFLISEGENILEKYGNHSSFVMFALGNELSGSLEQMKKMVNHFKTLDTEKLYAFGSNNYLGTRGQVEGEDFYVTCRVGADTDTTFSTHTRASFSFADAYDGGYINGRYPATNLNYAGAISKCSVPVIGHEIAQYEIYPNYDEMKKYTGVLKPWNFEIFKRRIIEAGMADQAMEFFRASGAASMLCYRADIEMALRTPGFGGFQLLDLQDFPGQGSALVGILDAFMDSKGLITPEEFSQFCNRVVPLLIMEKYCWENTETFKAKIQVANYSEKTLTQQNVKWELSDSNGKIVKTGMETADLTQGKLNDVSTIEVVLSEIKAPQNLTLQILLDGTPFKNSYPVWVYPKIENIEVPAEIFVTGKLNTEVLKKLDSGEKVLLFPQPGDLKDLTVGGLFTTDYWNYKMFKGISENNKKPVSPGTMGILLNPKHPLFNSFPTEFHTNWQWWSVVKSSHPFILDNAPEGYKPLIQVVDNIERNHKLGLIFEFGVGEGKLLVCMSDLAAIQDKPEGRQLYQSILGYMNSNDFQPATKITSVELKTLFSKTVLKKSIKTIGNISYQ